MASTDNIMDIFEADKNGVFSRNPGFLQELKEVRKYYEFYDGFKIEDLNKDYGQTWKTPTGMDYVPTREIRNLTKKLINKQGRFMFGISPTLLVKALTEGDTDAAEDKRAIYDDLLNKGKFWSQAAKAFVDSTIGKRVLLAITANPGKPLSFKFYTMPEFTYSMDSKNTGELVEVNIVHQDQRTKGEDAGAQLWHHHRYQMLNSRGELPEEDDEVSCWYEYRLTDGNENQMFAKQGEQGYVSNPTEEEQTATIVDSEGNEIPVILAVTSKYDTLLSTIPCYVILNEGLTGDTHGTSDVKDLMLIAKNYNRTISDYRDALRFKMFEQPVIIDGDSRSIKGLKIAPNALIDLKTDPRGGLTGAASRQAAVTTMSSTFNFTEPAKWYLENAKRDMYETMDIPMPEKVQDAPSAKSIKFLFYDLMARCDRKWLEWEPAILWALNLLPEIVEVIAVELPEYADKDVKSILATETVQSLIRNYPIPEDEAEKKKTAMDEVLANVKSRKTYIREQSDVENEDVEFDAILEEMGQMEEQSAGAMMPTINNELSNLDKDTTTEEDE